MDDRGDSLIETNSVNGGSSTCIADNSSSSNNNNNDKTSSSSSAEYDFIDHHNHPSRRSKLLTASFNQDGGCLAVGTANGFSVHNLHPQYNLSVERPLRGGIGQIEMLFRCNLMAIVGGGNDPHAAPHRVLIWDDHVPKEVGELSFRQIVLKVKLRKDAIAVALRDRVYVYNLADLSLRDKIYTADNPYGLLSLSTNVKDMVLACPSVTMGHVRVELYGLRKTMLIEAHESTLRALILTADGGKLATASHKGTIIRVWDVSTSQNIYEFRRGVERAQITCLAFSCDHQWLSCSSDKGTTHIFYLEKSEEETTKRKKNYIKKKNESDISKTNDTAGLSFLSSGMRSLISSTGGKSQPKSVCQIRGVPHPLACTFIGDAPNLTAVVGWDADGNCVLLICEFAAHQEARRVAYHVLVKNSSTADESEEERRRRRARGWVPNGISGGGGTLANLSEDDPTMHFGHLHISDEMAEEAHRFQTQTTDDDFCEVIVEPRKEPVIEDKHLSSSQEREQQQQQIQSQSLQNGIEEIHFSVNDNTDKDFLPSEETAEDDTDSKDSNNNNNNSKSNESHSNKINNTTTKEVGIDAGSVPIEPLEEDDVDQEE
mmetsp:Transcript_14822/g.16225  ORF Transcript_14822/g.16225 Transcript_14822/m.16225 type:complete len:601 (+) Transcript_14822:207-2009(+)